MVLLSLLPFPMMMLMSWASLPPQWTLFLDQLVDLLCLYFLLLQTLAQLLQSQTQLPSNPVKCIISLSNFEQTLKEITPSSESLGTGVN